MSIIDLVHHMSLEKNLSLKFSSSFNNCICKEQGLGLDSEDVMVKASDTSFNHTVLWAWDLDFKVRCSLSCELRE